jgi:membrane fusion protein, heavy metal efflux system
MPKSTIFLTIIFLLLIFSEACKCGKNSNEAVNPANEGLVEITTEQFNSEGMTIGHATMVKFEETIKINGHLMAPSGGIAQVGPAVAGAITGIFCKPGQYVKKGQALCSISSKEIVGMQQDFAETSTRLNALRIDYERAKSLYAEKVGSQKELLTLESEYKSTQARYEGLRSQLQLMNLNPKATESGAINPSYPIIAAISGYITMQNAILGKYSQPGELLFEIIDLNRMQLQLSVFEKDISKLKIGQPVLFTIQGKPDTTLLASLSSIGKSVDPESGSIKCIATLSGNDSKTLVHGMFVDATIATTEKITLALPTGAITKSGEEYFIFVVEKTDATVYLLKPLKVETGLEGNGFTQVIGIDSLKQVLIGGVYNLPVE